VGKVRCESSTRPQPQCTCISFACVARLLHVQRPHLRCAIAKALAPIDCEWPRCFGGRLRIAWPRTSQSNPCTHTHGQCNTVVVMWFHACAHRCPTLPLTTVAFCRDVSYVFSLPVTRRNMTPTYLALHSFAVTRMVASETAGAGQCHCAVGAAQTWCGCEQGSKVAQNE
jgi:hypothetical protein